MASLFTRIIDGEIPGHFVWTDDTCVVFLTIAPITPGHALVVPRAEVDHWIDLDDDVAAHLMVVAKAIGQAQTDAFAPGRIGMIIAGLEVPHTHLHVIPIESERDLDFAKADGSVSQEALAATADRLREALVARGHAAAVQPGSAGSSR
ncbi:MAG TPA: HIT family protein [Acidimicrobiales bacterium]|jgi:diadenosine tetraphosphate (Ap4A) HIT family hydrolase|nr:HIT family protein [Acidimicrobiales bacterium]